jgi:chromosome segregation ATPase
MAERKIKKLDTIEECKKEIKYQRDRVSVIAKQRDRLKETHVALKADVNEVGSLRIKIGDLHEENKSLKHANAVLTANIEDERAGILDLNKRLETAKKEVDGIVKLCDEKNSKIRDLEKYNTNISVRCDELSRNTSELDDTIKGLKSGIKTRNLLIGLVIVTAAIILRVFI